MLTTMNTTAVWIYTNNVYSPFRSFRLHFIFILFILFAIKQWLIDKTPVIIIHLIFKMFFFCILRRLALHLNSYRNQDFIFIGFSFVFFASIDQDVPLNLYYYYYNGIHDFSCWMKKKCLQFVRCFSWTIFPFGR